ncbi:sulfotransferase family 2 domain-containing protein [Mesorhizobium sp. KR9-304]|uniref:sulfotransferase family 2 domain-containing protein n=1 Tax=Mesorhizobium sp. KR9-304 TaxID=3156614 RepID=UPI0032B56ADE
MALLETRRVMQPARIAKAALAASVLWGRFGVTHVNHKAWKKIAVYPSLGLAYNRIKKNANTTVVMLLREMESGVGESRALAKRNSRKLLDLSPSEIANLRNTRFFVVTRNPYSRVLSAFLFRFKDEHYRNLHGAFDLTRSGFTNFVSYLSDGGLDRDAHWDLQTKVMFLPLDKYDTVVRFENFKSEMLSLLKSVGLQPPDGRLEGLYPSDVGKQTSSDSRLGEFYTPETIRMVADLYSKDFQDLRYSKDFPLVTR